MSWPDLIGPSRSKKRIFFNMAWMAGSEPGHDKTVFAKEIARTFAPLTEIESNPPYAVVFKCMGSRDACWLNGWSLIAKRLAWMLR